MSSGALADTWGAGNFIALKFTPSDEDTDATAYEVGVDPSQGSGLVQLDEDMDAVIKVTDKNAQVLVVATIGDGARTTQTYDLSGLTCETA